MYEHNEQLTDLDADVLDAIFAVWIQQSRATDVAVIVSVDEILSMRGLEKKIGGEGRRGGFRPKQRARVLAAITRLQNLYIDVYITIPGTKQKHFHGRPFTVTDCKGKKLVYGFESEKRFRFHPGEAIALFLTGSWRPTALLAVKVLQFDPYRQMWEKRLARYLSWQWRICVPKCTHLEAYRVATLLEAADITPDVRNPMRTYERFEKALDTLHDEDVIAGWQFECWKNTATEYNNWLQEWLQAKVIIAPPDAIKIHYQSISKHEKSPPKSHIKAEHWGHQIRALRKKLGLTQLQVAEDLGIDRTHLSRLESGKRGKKSNSSQLKKVKRWLERYGHD